MHPQHYPVPASLSAYIAFYGIIDVDEHFYEAFCSPPLALCGFQFNFEGNLDVFLNGEPFFKDRHCVTGQITSPMTGRISGRTKRLLVFIHPCGIYQLFGFDMSLLTNTSMPLSDFLGASAYEKLMENLTKAGSDDAMVEVMNQYFLSQQPFFSIAPKVANALDYIHESKANISVKDIETNCFITARSLERHFRLYIGLSPKEYIKIYRFKCLINYINQHPGVRWEDLCEQNGYYDQSHLTRYFTRYMKRKPAEMVHVDQEFINYLLQEP